MITEKTPLELELANLLVENTSCGGEEADKVIPMIFSLLDSNKHEPRVSPKTAYDSTIETIKHMKRVNQLLLLFAEDVMKRAAVHDQSKLEEPEKTAFDEFTPLLKNCTYGSDEYKSYLSKLNVALKHHYENNTHHPEHYENSISGMNLLDIIEMFFDWKAASERHADGNIDRSISINQKRFEMDEQIAAIFRNTVKLYENNSRFTG